MYQIKIPHPQQGQAALRLQTENRNLARAAMMLGQENHLAVEVTEEVKPRVVKFKGVD